MLTDPALSHVSFDISWDEVAKYAVASPESIARVADLNRYPTASCSAPTRSRRRGRAGITPCTTCGRRCGAADARGEPQGAHGATTSGSSTKAGGESARGNRPRT